MPDFLIPNLNPVEYGLRPEHAGDVELINRLLGEVLYEQDCGDIVEFVRRLVSSPDKTLSPQAILDHFPSEQAPRKLQQSLRILTIFFHGLNRIEQKEIARVNAARQVSGSATPRPDSLHEAVQYFKRSGRTADDIREVLHGLDIEPTLTAHPTEARRRAVQNTLDDITWWLCESDQVGGIVRLDKPIDWSQRPERELRRLLVQLWQTNEFPAHTIAVADEVANSLYFFEHTIFDVVTWLQDDLDRYLREAYHGETFDIPPAIRFRSWVGGDRDGNPKVTAEVTWQTLVAHKEMALRHYLQEILRAQRELRISQRLATVTPELMDSIKRDRWVVNLPNVRWERLADEPYHLKLQCIASRLEANLAQLDDLQDWHAEGPDLGAHGAAYRSSEELLADLQLCQESLRTHHASRLADEGPLAELVSKVRTFGFRLATLDIRQHSDRHEEVLSEIFEAAHILEHGRTYQDLGENERIELLTRELTNPRPMLPRNWVGSETARELMSVFEVIAHAKRYIADSAIQSYIISMTHQISDMLEALLLAKEAGLIQLQRHGGRLVFQSDIDIVPLFETIDDLQRSTDLMSALFDNEVYRMQLEARGSLQEIMLGYSDSSKDGGFLAANWALYQSQEELTTACRKAGVTLRLFHGRGGTVGRGGGRANRAILAAPPGSVQGRIRFTEQGEIISFRYSLPPLANRHLEQIMHAVMLASDPRRDRLSIPGSYREAMASMAEQSRRVYRDLVYNDEAFWDFYRQATPIAHISRLPIASRPMFRPEQMGVGLAALRAIPWNFAWVQCGYGVPGWFGVGSALASFVESDPNGLERLREMYQQWNFFQSMIDNCQLELLRADLETAKRYAARVEPAELGERMHKSIETEFHLTRQWVLKVIQADDLLTHAKVARRAVDMRKAISPSMNLLQIALMHKWDELPDDSEQRAAWHDALLLSLSGIASAMQTTG